MVLPLLCAWAVPLYTRLDSFEFPFSSFHLLLFVFICHFCCCLLRWVEFQHVIFCVNIFSYFNKWQIKIVVLFCLRKDGYEHHCFLAISTIHCKFQFINVASNRVSLKDFFHRSFFSLQIRKIMLNRGMIYFEVSNFILVSLQAWQIGLEI